MKIRLLRSAYLDLAEGRNFYERQAKHLGEYFFTSLFADLDTLEVYAGIHRQMFGYYRLLSKRFPYAIYYKIIAEEIIVFRVMDCRQNPAKTDKFFTTP